MTLEEEYRLLVSGYYGIYEMDEYELKVYVLKEIENYIKEFIKEYPLTNYNYLQVAEEIEKEPLKTKLQDSLLVLNKIKGPLELVMMVNLKITELIGN